MGMEGLVDDDGEHVGAQLRRKRPWQLIIGNRERDLADDPGFDERDIIQEFVK